MDAGSIRQPTGSKIGIGKVVSLFRARGIDTPKGTARLTLSQAKEINLTGQGAVIERLCELLIVDAVVVQRTKQNGQIDMTVYFFGSATAQQS
jgi:hypothetical protein